MRLFSWALNRILWCSFRGRRASLHFSAQFSPMWGSVRFTDIVNTHKLVHPSSAQPVLFRGTNIYYASVLCRSLCLAFKISHLNVKTTLQMRDYYLHGSNRKPRAQRSGWLPERYTESKSKNWCLASKLKPSHHTAPLPPTATMIWPLNLTLKLAKSSIVFVAHLCHPITNVFPTCGIHGHFLPRGVSWSFWMFSPYLTSPRPVVDDFCLSTVSTFCFMTLLC